jgi:hypothetical protein
MGLMVKIDGNWKGNCGESEGVVFCGSWDVGVGVCQGVFGENEIEILGRIMYMVSAP